MFSSSGSPCPGLGGDETHRYEMALAQGLLKRVVELLRRNLRPLLEVQRHQALIQLDDLVDDPGVAPPPRSRNPWQPPAAWKKTIGDRGFRCLRAG